MVANRKIINIPDDWYVKLKPMLESEYFLNLARYIKEARSKTKVFPESPQVFRAFNETPLNDVRVVILGMD